MTEYNEVQRIVAESYRTRIDAEELRREVKALLNEANENTDKVVEEEGAKSRMYPYWRGVGMAYATIISLIDEKEKGR